MRKAWEMTTDEWKRTLRRIEIPIENSFDTNNFYEFTENGNWRRFEIEHDEGSNQRRLRGIHRIMVKKALAKNENIPQKVIDEYVRG